MTNPADSEMPRGIARLGTFTIGFESLPKHIGIVGSRSYPRRDIVQRFVSCLTPSTTVVSGECETGVDAWAKSATLGRPGDLSYEGFEALWRPGEGGVTDLRAGLKRNTRLVEHLSSSGGMLIAFGSRRFSPRAGRWQELSSGTRHVCAEAVRLKLPLLLFYSVDRQT